MPHNETWKETLAQLDAGQRYQVRCPDGQMRVLWGYCGPTGDLFVWGWPGNVWMDCRDGTLRAEFEPPSSG